MSGILAKRNFGIGDIKTGRGDIDERIKQCNERDNLIFAIEGSGMPASSKCFNFINGNCIDEQGAVNKCSLHGQHVSIDRTAIYATLNIKE